MGGCATAIASQRGSPLREAAARRPPAPVGREPAGPTGTGRRAGGYPVPVPSDPTVRRRPDHMDAGNPQQHPQGRQWRQKRQQLPDGVETLIGLPGGADQIGGLPEMVPRQPAWRRVQGLVGYPGDAVSPIEAAQQVHCGIAHAAVRVVVERPGGLCHWCRRPSYGCSASSVSPSTNRLARNAWTGWSLLSPFITSSAIMRPTTGDSLNP